LSSILKALKKLENQAKDKHPDRLPQQKDQQQNLQPQPMIDHLRSNRRYLVILTGLIIAAAAGIMLHQKIRYNNQKAAAKKTVAIKEKTRHQRPAPLPNKKPVLANKVEKKSLPPQKITEPERTNKETKISPAPVYASRPVPQDVLGKKTLPSKQAQKGTIAGKSNEKHEPNGKLGRFAKIPVKQSNQTEIEIQAIAWSKDPISRLAVINGLILREGESIDNVMVVNIDKDAVVFEKGGQKWKQLFGF
jgi:Type II secretion system protein B